MVDSLAQSLKSRRRAFKPQGTAGTTESSSRRLRSPRRSGGLLCIRSPRLSTSRSDSLSDFENRVVIKAIDVWLGESVSSEDEDAIMPWLCAKPKAGLWQSLGYILGMKHLVAAASGRLVIVNSRNQIRSSTASLGKGMCVWQTADPFWCRLLSGYDRRRKWQATDVRSV